jgi:DNA-binding NtrC family response regulator
MTKMPERILIVEDEDTLCESLQRVFRREGYEADIADSAETAFRLLENTTYDLILTDVILPGISGIELIARYKEQNPDQKVIIMTAYASLQTAVEALRVGACDFIVKPIMHDELKRMVKKALER